MENRTYIGIDLKSFYASVECRELGLDPLTTNLVVADISRTEKTICLAVTPSLKAYGIPGRARLFEVVQAVKRINAQRLRSAPGHAFSGKSCDARELAADPSLELDYIVSTPRMAYYMQYSTRIVDTYLKYVSFDDMIVYSIDEVFIDVTAYIRTLRITAHEFALRMVRDVLKTTGITATAGIGPNLYLAKVAMDVMAKKMPADKDGVRIAELTERSYREHLWEHRPLTDFWRVGKGIARKLEAHGLFTMGDVALQSERNEELLYNLFGVNAELLIDHAWGWEPTTIQQIKAYKPQSSSLSVGQVLSEPYTKDMGRIILREMSEGLVLALVEKGLVTDQVVLTVGYDKKTPEEYTGTMEENRYGQIVPKQAHGSQNIGKATSSTKLVMNAFLELYDRIVNPNLYVRRMYVVANHVIPAEEASAEEPAFEQMDLFTDYEEKAADDAAEADALEKERRLQETMLELKNRFGKNIILHGTSYQEGATGRDRNEQVGGHRR